MFHSFSCNTNRIWALCKKLSHANCRKSVTYIETLLHSQLHWTSLPMQIHWTASFLSSLPPPPHWSHILVTIGISLYDTILMVTWVQYDLSGLVLYNINLGATTMTSLSTRGVTIPINLVISTTGLLTVNSSSVKSLMALGYSAWVQLWCCEDKESVIRGTGVQRRAQSSSWTDDERKLDLSRERRIQDWGKVQLLRDTYTWYRTAYSK